MVYIYTAMLALCIYRTYTAENSAHYYLFAHCFVKGLHLFLIFCFSGAWWVYSENNANSSYFDGPTDWKAAGGLEKRRSASTLTGFDDDKHNFVTF